MNNHKDFSLHALYLELDSVREQQGLSWSEVAKAINGASNRTLDKPTTGHALAASTIKATEVRSIMEGDGILQMLRWLNRSPESFVPGFANGELDKYSLPVPPEGCMIRFDTRKIYTTIDDAIQRRGISWKQAAEEMGAAITQLKHLEKGGRTSFPMVVRIALWLDIPTAQFVRIILHQ